MPVSVASFRPHRFTLAAALTAALIAAVLFAIAYDDTRAHSRLAAPLIPTAVVSSVIVVGGPDGSGHPVLWLAVFIVITQVVWTCIIYAILAAIIGLCKTVVKPLK